MKSQLLFSNYNKEFKNWKMLCPFFLKWDEIVIKIFYFYTIFRTEILWSGPNSKLNTAPDLGPVWEIKNPTGGVALIRLPSLAQIRRAFLFWTRDAMSGPSLDQKKKSGRDILYKWIKLCGWLRNPGRNHVSGALHLWMTSIHSLFMCLSSEHAHKETNFSLQKQKTDLVDQSRKWN